MSGVVCVVCPFADDEKLKNVVCPFADDEKYMCIGAHWNNLTRNHGRAWSFLMFLSFFLVWPGALCRSTAKSIKVRFNGRRKPLDGNVLRSVITSQSLHLDHCTIYLYNSVGVTIRKTDDTAIPTVNTSWHPGCKRGDCILPSVPIYFAAAFSIHFVPRCMCLASFLCAAHVHAETILWSRGVHKCL